VTLPVGVAPVGATVAVKVMECPKVLALTEDVSEVAVVPFIAAAALPMRICSPSADDGCRHPAVQHHRCWVPALRVSVRCRTPWRLAADVEGDTRRADIIPVMLIFTNFKATSPLIRVLSTARTQAQ
jgi:hypothetical protein